MTPDALALLHAQSFTTPRPWTAQEFADLLAAPGSFVTGDDTSFAMGRVIADEAELLTLATAPRARRKGLGRAALRSYEAKARALGAVESFLEVAADNTVARRLYAAEGYRQAGCRPGYYRAQDGSSVDALVLRKPLT